MDYTGRAIADRTPPEQEDPAPGASHTGLHPGGGAENWCRTVQPRVAVRQWQYPGQASEHKFYIEEYKIIRYPEMVSVISVWQLVVDSGLLNVWVLTVRGG